LRVISTASEDRGLKFRAAVIGVHWGVGVLSNPLLRGSKVEQCLVVQLRWRWRGAVWWRCWGRERLASWWRGGSCANTVTKGQIELT